MGAADAVKGLFGQKKQQDQAVEKLEALRVSLSSELKLQLSNKALQKMAGAEEHIQCAEFADGMSVHLIAGKDRGGQATVQRREKYSVHHCDHSISDGRLRERSPSASSQE